MRLIWFHWESKTIDIFRNTKSLNWPNHKPIVVIHFVFYQQDLGALCVHTIYWWCQAPLKHVCKWLSTNQFGRQKHLGNRKRVQQCRFSDPWSLMSKSEDYLFGCVYSVLTNPCLINFRNRITTFKSIIRLKTWVAVAIRD
jgi:hypothetical protein